LVKNSPEILTIPGYNGYTPGIKSLYCVRLMFVPMLSHGLGGMKIMELG